MRVAILSSFPLIDRHGYKKHFLLELLKKPYVRPQDVLLVYSKARLRDYRAEARRFGHGDVLHKLHQFGAGRAVSAAEPSAPKGTLGSLARGLGIEVTTFDVLSAPACVNLLRRFAPDVIHNLSGVLVPKEVLGLSPAGVVSGHYGMLPELRGTDVVRWSIYLNMPVAVCHMSLAAELDMGDILSTRPVAVHRGDRFDDIYGRCQRESAEGHLALLDTPQTGPLERRRQRKEEGCVYQRMGRLLRDKVDAALAAQAYCHYV